MALKEKGIEGLFSGELRCWSGKVSLLELIMGWHWTERVLGILEPKEGERTYDGEGLACFAGSGGEDAALERAMEGRCS